jgi:hypothetical protein
MKLECIYDTRKSFYGKAWIEKIFNAEKGVLKLYSYGTHVATITDYAYSNKRVYEYFGKYSQTTTRHQKEFFRQYGLNDKEIKELFEKGTLEKEV